MKICWDNLEGLKYNKKTDKWYKGNAKYIYKDACKNCGEPFLARHNSNGIFCCKKCSNCKENNPMYGKKHSDKTKQKIGLTSIDRKPSKETRRKIGESIKGRKHSDEAKKKIGNFHKGKTVSEETRRKLSDSHKGKILSQEHKEKISSSLKKWHNKSDKSPWIGMPNYDTYASQLDWCEEVRRCTNNKDILEVKCAYCGKWFIPLWWDVRSRIQSLNGNYKGECRLYCSNECKHACPIYHKKPETLMKEDAVRAGRMPWLELDREVQHELRQMVLERDGYKCVKCGSKGPLHCHHILPVAVEPLLSADVDNCITLCEDCHKAVHQQDGCRYGQLRNEVC